MHSSANNSAVSTTVSCKVSRKPQRWWTSQCTSARNKHRFWLSLWRSSGRPREGAVYDSYKYSKHLFRKSCRLAINNSLNENFRDCDTMFRQRRMGAFWRKIKKSNESDNFKCISIDSLENHFREKFAYNFDNETDFINAARREVNDKMKQCEDSYSNFIFTERMLRKYISVLKSECSPGIDGITSVHIKFASNSEIMLHLCNLFSLCFIYGIVPTVFTKGLLVPILKKPTLDPSVAKNYRPVIVSRILSKLIELFIIDECNTVKLSDFQFGFVPGRGTNTAISLAHDVASYCNYNSSPVFMWGLDAEGAFDGIPHPILFRKAMNVLKDMHWKLLYNWYKNITVQIKWKVLGSKIVIGKGTRQGGLTSTLLFNLFYKDLIDELAECEGGISIASHRFNVFCYADDILLASTTVTGLQRLINCAVNYISNHGLRFNPGKTQCIIYGKNPFNLQPSWHIDTCELQIAENLEYLGTFLGHNGSSAHISKRITSCRRAFYSLQGAGICKNGLEVNTAVYVFKATCLGILKHASNSVYLSQKQRSDLNKIQGNLLKCLVGLGPRYRTTPLLNAVYMSKVSSIY